MGQPRIFISMGTPYSDKYRGFRDELEQILRDACNADPRIIGKNEYPEGSPLTKIRDVMSDCDGVIIVAYERKYIKAGSEKRTSPAPQVIEDAAYTTPWNHIESAMAFAMNIPLYIICERGLKEEGLIESKINWYAQYMDFDRSNLRSPDVLKSLQAWISSTKTKRKKTKSILQMITGTVKLSEMTPKEIVAAFSILAAAFALGSATARYIPALLAGP